MEKTSSKNIVMALACRFRKHLARVSVMGDEEAEGSCWRPSWLSAIEVWIPQGSPPDSPPKTYINSVFDDSLTDKGAWDLEKWTPLITISEVKDGQVVKNWQIKPVEDRFVAIA